MIKFQSRNTLTRKERKEKKSTKDIEAVRHRCKNADVYPKITKEQGKLRDGVEKLIFLETKVSA